MFFSRSDFFPLALSIYLLLIISFLGFLFLFVEVLLISYRLKPTKRDDLVPHFLPDKYRRWTVVKGGGFCGGLILQDDSKGEGLLPSRKLTELLMRAQKGQRILMGSLLPTKA